jgi:FlaA1/EpsC-like NDP-sugar epimerase
MKKFFKGKRVLVTGACGTVGSELVRQLLEVTELGELIGIDNNESENFFIEQQYRNICNARFILADIRDLAKMIRVMKGIDIVFHTAAYKHVILCERSPFEAVRTNIIGVQNIISAAYENRVERVIFTSSDKAVNPTNVMGTSKLMGERIMSAANSNNRGEAPIFTSTRFGNVLGSKGSVFPVFREQIKKGGPVTVTDSNMTRFIMSIEQAVRLVLDSSRLAKGGEVFVTKMPVIQIMDLAEVMIHELAPRYGYLPEKIDIIYIGKKPGEKMYEELMSFEETKRAMELELYFTVIPAFRGQYQNIKYEYPNVISTEIKNPYHSGNEQPLSKKEILEFLKQNSLIEKSVTKKEFYSEWYWPNEYIDESKKEHGKNMTKDYREKFKAKDLKVI